MGWLKFRRALEVGLGYTALVNCSKSTESDDKMHGKKLEEQRERAERFSRERFEEGFTSFKLGF